MACTLERPDPQTLFNRYMQMFSVTVLGGAPIIPESNEWYATSVNYAMAEEFYAISAQLYKEADPREACCENLVAIAERDGVYPRPAVSAQGYVTLTGTANTVLPTPLEFTISEQTFITSSEADQPTALDANGSATIRVRAAVAGSLGNIKATTGTLNYSIAGVNRNVGVCGGTFCNGTDAETCEAFRARYLRRLQYNPRATSAWITDKLLEWPCSTRAMPRGGSCCQCERDSNCTDCGCSDCGSKLEFYLMFDNSFPCGIAPASVIAEVEKWLFGSPQGYGLGQVEIGVCGRVVPVTAVPVNVRVDVADCLSATGVLALKASLTEYFTTLTPSTPLKVRAIETVIANALQTLQDVSANLELVNEVDGYGGVYGPRTTTSKVFHTGCDLEPECDYMLCLNEIIITSSNTTASGCP